MSKLDPNKLHVHYGRRIKSDSAALPRRYTLTHSDLTGELYLSIGLDYNYQAISGLYTRLMRDEILAQWLDDESGLALHVYCHVSGGIVFGSAKWRDEILRYHMPQVLQAFRYGDRDFFRAHPNFDRAPVYVHFNASQKRFQRIESWGELRDYRVSS